MGIATYGEPLQPFERAEVPAGPGEITIAIEYCGVCGTDVKIVQGDMPFSARVPLPHVPGHEIVGRITTTGADVGLEIGTRVVVYDYGTCGACPSCLAGRETTCSALNRRVGFTDPGGMQESITLPSTMAVPLPASIPAEAAAAVSCAIGTAYRAVATLGAVQAGARVAVIGAGGVGLHAIQIARACGADVLVVEPADHRRAAAEESGANVTVPSFTELGSALGEGAATVIECSGQPAVLPEAVRIAAPGGRVVLVGYAPAVPANLDAQELVLKEVSVLGSRYTTRRDLAHAVALVANGTVRPVVSEIYPLAEANQAIAAVRAGSAPGRIVVAIE